MARTYVGLDVDSSFGGRFPWKSKKIDVSPGTRMAYVDHGPRYAPLTFVLLHGNPTWGFLYRSFIALLAKRYRVIVPDHVGFGRSDKPRLAHDYSLDNHIDNLTHLLESVDARNVVLVMQDWGGPIGLGWATKPEHAERVAGIAILNTWAFVRLPELKLPFLFRFLVRGKRGWRRVLKNNTFTEWFVRRGGRKLDDAEMAAYRAPHPTPADRVGVARFAQMVPETEDTNHPEWATMARIEDALPALAAKPSIVIWAMKDKAFRKAHLERWTALLTNMDGPHLLPDATHYLQEDASDAILKEIWRWAANLSAAPSTVGDSAGQGADSAADGAAQGTATDGTASGQSATT